MPRPDDNHDDEEGTPRANGRSLASLHTLVAVLGTDVKNMKETLTSRLLTIETNQKEAAAQYATKTDVASVEKSVADVQGNIRWAIRIVISMVIIGVMTIAFKSGLVHP